jgi:hypothetical protein
MRRSPAASSDASGDQTCEPARYRLFLTHVPNPYEMGYYFSAAAAVKRRMAQARNDEVSPRRRNGRPQISG